MTLTKKHFKAIADIISDYILIDSEAENDNPYKYTINQGMELINDFCDYFKTLNPLFNETEFKKSCLK
jgi:hypothetical protein